MSEAYCPPPPKGIGEYTTEELQQELASRDRFLGDFSMEVGGQHFVDHVKVAIKNECRYRGIPMLDDMQIGVVITSLRNHSYAMLMTRYDRRERFDLTKVTDFYPIESSVGRFLRDAGNELIDRAEAAKSVSNDEINLQKSGSDSDVTRTVHDVLIDLERSAYLSAHAPGYTKVGVKVRYSVKALADIEQLVLDVIGSDVPGDTNIMIAAEHARQHQALEKVMGGE